jgi:hypothetical protein
VFTLAYTAPAAMDAVPRANPDTNPNIERT